MKILLVEDELKINQLLSLYLTQDGHEVFSKTNASEAIELFKQTSFHLVITDLMLPGLQGESFIKQIKTMSDVHIIVLTAKTNEHSKLTLLKDGVDDYITKPFSFDEVLIKVRNLEKRIMKTKLVRFTYHNKRYLFNASTYTLKYSETLVKLNHTEACILSTFYNHAHQALSRDQIIDACLKDSDAYDRIVDTYIKNLRKKLGEKTLIETIYGHGYRFNGELYG